MDNKFTSSKNTEKRKFSDRKPGGERRGSGDKNGGFNKTSGRFSKERKSYGNMNSDKKGYSEKNTSFSREKKPYSGDKPFGEKKYIDRKSAYNSDKTPSERKGGFSSRGEKAYPERKFEGNGRRDSFNKDKAQGSSRYSGTERKPRFEGAHSNSRGEYSSKKRYSDNGVRFSDKSSYTDGKPFDNNIKNTQKGRFSSKPAGNRDTERKVYEYKPAFVKPENEEITEKTQEIVSVKVEQPIEKPVFSPKAENKTESTVLDKKLETVLHLLINVDKNGKSLKESLENNETYQLFDKHSKVFVRKIVQGVFEKRLTLDSIIESLVDGRKIKAWLMEILRVIAYRILYTRADVNEVIYQGVELCKKYVSPELAPYTTAIARKLERSKNEYDPENRTYKNSVERIAYIYSWPTEVISNWTKNYGQDIAVLIASQKIKNKGVAYMLSLDEEDNETLMYELEDNNISHSKGIVNRTIFFDDISAVNDMTVYKEGKLVVRGLGAILVAKILDAGKNDNVLVIGKNTEEITACIKDRSDAGVTLFDGDDPGETGLYSKIVVAPKSGEFGKVASAPDVKAQLGTYSFTKYTQAQRAALDAALKNLSANGTMLYFTNTVCNAENEDMVSSFVAENPSIEVLDIDNLIPDELKYIKLGKMLLILPDDVNSEAFFIAAMRKK
ncbi:MAG: hypothetical protein E7315_02665 [Clostridiales bacterium]|nr:hypothetical protein [Clostridiales bacterium]